MKAAAPQARTFICGHLNEGNLHVNVLGALDAGGKDPDGTGARSRRPCFTLLPSGPAAISSEHGVGRAKAEWLALSRTAAEIAVMRAVKRRWTPRGAAQPGVLFAAS